jgi:hypothetical protein
MARRDFHWCRWRFLRTARRGVLAAGVKPYSLVEDLDVFDFFQEYDILWSYPPGDSISGPTPTRKGGSSLYSAKGIPVQRVIAYIDGYNLYYGLRTKRWKWFYWLNVQSMARRLLKPDQTLVSTKYFTTIVKHPPDKQRRQAVFLEALQTLNDLQIFYPNVLSNSVFPDQVVKPDGFVLHRPAEWR